MAAKRNKVAKAKASPVQASTLTRGQKAAQTRRANVRAAMLSARALKAWETRRANAA